MNIVFFGTPEVAETILTDLIEHHVNIVGIVTRPDKPKGRSKKLKPPPVKSCAQDKLPSVPIFQPPKASTPEFAQSLKQLNPDVFVVVAYGEIIKQFLLDIPRLGCINVHFSLLPKWRGAAPMQHAIMAGDRETGVCVIEMVAAMDAGDIFGISKLPLPDDMTCGELSDQLCASGGPLVRKVLGELESGTVKRIIQDVNAVTLAPKIQPQMTQIDWSQSANDIHNQIRALAPKPGAWTYAQVGGEKRRIKILLSKVSVQGEWIESCGEGNLEILKVQLEGKKPIETRSFLLGNPNISIVK